jgi:HNH endonuclease
MKIPLSNGGVALVDDDIGDLLKWTWRCDITGYPARDTTVAGKKQHLRLHTVVIGAAPLGFVTDHKNGDKLDNRRENLRFVTKSLNTRNNYRQSGVSWHEGDQAWRVRFKFHGKELWYGNFEDEAEARSIAHLLKGALIYHELVTER